MAVFIFFGITNSLLVIITDYGQFPSENFNYSDPSHHLISSSFLELHP